MSRWQRMKRWFFRRVLRRRMYGTVVITSIEPNLITLERWPPDPP